MLKSPLLAAPIRNRLLARLPGPERDRLLARLEPVPLEFRQVLYRRQSPIDFVYFPNRGSISAVRVMTDGSTIEVATIGDEGMTDLMALVGARTAPNEIIVQVPGDALRMSVKDFQEEAEPDGPLRRLLLRYHSAFFTQVSYCVACTGLHTVRQRCCRWLLMCRDRVESDVLPLTQETLALMLGVRRSSVTEVLQSLQDRGLIHKHRGEIALLDRKGLEAACCECYRGIKDEYASLLG